MPGYMMVEAVEDGREVHMFLFIRPVAVYLR
jgi:hypothetical protein